MSHDRAKAFRDARAGESALYFVENRLDYAAPDEAAFWADAESTVDRLLGALGVRVDADDEVVDVGCGVGWLTRVLASRARHVHALDVSPRMLALDDLHRAAADGGMDVELIVGEGTQFRLVRTRKRA